MDQFINCTAFTMVSSHDKLKDKLYEMERGLYWCTGSVADPLNKVCIKGCVSRIVHCYQELVNLANQSVFPQLMTSQKSCATKMTKRIAVVANVATFSAGGPDIMKLNMRAPQLCLFNKTTEA